MESAPQVQDKTRKKIHFKVIKKDDVAILSGIVASEDTKNRLIDAYGKVFDSVNSDALHIEKNINEDGLIDFFTNFADNFSKFDAGYLAFANASVEVDGIAQDEIIEQTLQEQLSSLKNIKVDNRLFIKQKKEDVINNTNITKKIVSKKSPEDIQKKLNALLSKNRVQFLYARDILTSSSKQLVDEIGKLLKENKDIKIEISGHTDSDGTKKNNLRLSQRRAKSVKSYLIKQGISTTRIKAIGYGESRPLVANDSLKNKEINRRVEFKVIGE